MAVGVCGSCERAYVWHHELREEGNSCPRCGEELEVTAVQRMDDLPPFPLRLLGQAPRGPRPTRAAFTR